MNRHRELSPQAGMTIIEVMVAVLILLVGVGMSVTLFPATERQSQVALRQEKASAIAEREIERIRALPFAQVAVSPTPSLETDADCSLANPLSPTCHINGSRYRILNDFNNKDSGPLPGTPINGEMILNQGAIIPYEQMPIDGGTAHVFRYVTEREENCPLQASPLLNPLVAALTPALSWLMTNLNNTIQNALSGILSTRLNLFCLDNAPSHADTKRVVVAVRLSPAGNGPRPIRPVYLTTIMTDPSRGVLN